ncbi:MAG: cell filamentation protein Fic, partial [bacterium (Candidatus Stahlbacteria) CG23_combo_of_CG06-09_8_20_14_all_40_9]
RKEAISSSQVEGTQATFADVLKVEANIKDPAIPDDVQEILNYIEAMNYGIKRLESLPLSLRLIREIHQILLRGVRGKYKNPGEFRESQNWVGGRTINTASYVPPPVSELSPLLDNLEKFFYDKSPMPILIKTALIHSQFELIHPFLDGNGRVGRLLITFYLCQQEILQKPLLYLSDYFKRYRTEYYDRLGAIHKKDNFEDWIKFFLDGVIEISKEAVNLSRKIVNLREQDVKKVSNLGKSTKSALSLLESLYKSPIITVKSVEKATGLSPSNANALVEKFVNLEILEKVGERKRNRRFVYKKYLALFEISP